MNLLRLFFYFILVSGICFEIRAESFTDAAESLLKSSRDVKIAEKDLRIASSKLSSAWSEYYPQITGKIEGSNVREEYEDSLNDYMDLSATVSLSQDIVNMKKVYDIKSAGKKLLSMKIRLEEVKQRAILNLGVAWIEYWKAVKRRKIGDNNAEILKKYREKSRIRYNSGEITITDVRLAETKYHGALSRKISFLREFNRAKRELEELTGKKAPKTITLFDFKIKPDKKKFSSFVKNHPSVRVLMAELAATVYNVKKERSGHYPTLGVVSSYTYQNEGEYDKDKYPYRESRIGLELKIPLFSGNSVSDSTDAAILEKSKQSLKLQQGKKRVLRDIRISSYNLEQNLKEIKIAEKQLKYAFETLDGMNEEYSMGTRTATDVFQTQADMITSRLSLITTKEQYAKSLLNYLFATGRLKPAFLKTISR